MKTTSSIGIINRYHWLALALALSSVFSCQAPRVLVSEEKIQESIWKLKEQVLSSGMQLLGKPYQKAAKGPDRFDCSGLVQFIFSGAGISIGPSSKQQSLSGKEITLKEALPGDLIFFGKNDQINHVGVITANKEDAVFVLHSTSSKGVLHEDILKSDYWVRRMIRINRFESYLPTK